MIGALPTWAVPYLGGQLDSKPSSKDRSSVALLQVPTLHSCLAFVNKDCNLQMEINPFLPKLFLVTVYQCVNTMQTRTQDTY